MPHEREVVRDRAGRILGTYRDNGAGWIEARDAAGRLLGSYRKAQDETRDASGRFLGTGNLLPALVCRP